MGTQLVGLQVLTGLLILATLLLQPSSGYQGFDCGQGMKSGPAAAHDVFAVAESFSLVLVIYFVLIDVRSELLVSCAYPAAHAGNSDRILWQVIRCCFEVAVMPCIHPGNAHLQLVEHVNCHPVLKVACFEQLYFSVQSCGVKAWPHEKPGSKDCKKIRILANVTGEEKVTGPLHLLCVMPCILPLGFGTLRSGRPLLYFAKPCHLPNGPSSLCLHQSRCTKSWL